MHCIIILTITRKEVGGLIGTEDDVLNFESAMMCTNNVVVDVVVMNLHIMDVVVLISLTQSFPLTHLLPSSCLFFLFSGDVSVVTV